MAYTIVKTDGTVLTTIADGTVNTTSTPLQLPGRNYSSYGQVMDTNFVHLLENFASSNVPQNSLRGQLWFNTSNQSLYVCPTQGESNVSNWIRLLTVSGNTLNLGNLVLTSNLYANNAFLSNTVSGDSITANDLTVNSNADISGNVITPNLIANTIVSGTTTGTINGNWNLTSNLTVNTIKSDNYQYANGDPINFTEAAGSTNEIQYNDSDSLSSSSNLTFNPSTNVLTVNGNINATRFIGNGIGITNSNAANLTGTIAPSVQTNITSLGTLSTVTVSGTATVGNVAATGNVSAIRLTGSLTTPSQPNITSVGTLTNLISTGNVDFTGAGNVSLGPIQNIKITGGISGYVLSTNGSGDLSFVNSNTLIPNVGGSNTQIQFNNNGELGATSNLTFDTNTNLLTVNGNVSASNASLGNLVTANFFQGNGYNLSNLRGANILGQAPNAIVAGTVYTNAQPNITSVGTLTNLDVTNDIVASGNISAVYFLGDGSQLTNLSAGSSTTAVTVTANAQPNITSVGTLTSLNVSGNIVSNNANLGNAARANFFIGSGANLTNINGSNVTGAVANATYANSAGLAAVATLAGTVTANAQPNITSVGPLTSIFVTGNITSGNASLGNTAIAAFFQGDGSKLTNITGGNVVGTVASATVASSANSVAGANVSGTVANATYATSAGSAGTATSATTAGTVTTNAQPNITSLGTLSGASISGIINATGGIIELGSLSFPSSPYIDFHSSGTGSDYDSRIIASGGNSLSGSGNLNIVANTLTQNGVKLLNPSNFTITYGTITTYSYTNIVGQFSDSANYFDVFPPAGYTMANLIAFLPSIAYIYFAGGVNGDDALRCIHSVLADRIRVYVQNTEQSSNPAANFVAFWRR
jgi:hypothetical protein